MDAEKTKRLRDELLNWSTLDLSNLREISNDILIARRNAGQEVNFGRKILDHLSFGIEFFPERNFNLRLGYNAKRGNELAVLDQRNFSGISGGFGFRMSTFRFDYAHVRYHNAANVNMIGISIDLNGKRY